MKWIFTLTLLALTASAQLPTGPDLRIVVGNEGYPNLAGITAVAPHTGDARALTIWAKGTNEHLLAFNLEVVNIGDEPWTPLTHPEYLYLDTRFTKPKLKD